MMIEGVKLDETLADVTSPASELTLVDHAPLTESRETDTAVVAHVVVADPEVSKSHHRKFQRHCQVELWRQFGVLGFEAYLSTITQERGVSLRPSRVATF
jgi:hypothetical protein